MPIARMPDLGHCAMRPPCHLLKIMSAYLPVFDPEGPMYMPMADVEDPNPRPTDESAETLEELETPTGRLE